MNDSVGQLSAGIVAIGRNEGERLRGCLASLAESDLPIFYVDSGSDDGSPELAASLGAEVHPLDASRPFCASRARQEGAERLLASQPNVQAIFFVDADCVVAEGWIEQAVEALQKDPKLGAVCGRRRERSPHASVYNLMCDHEWDTPVGECQAVGGDALFRVAAYQEAGGFDPTVPAGEEPELCQRLRRAGWKLERIDADMTVHDAALTSFAPWWRRQVRTGYSGADVEARFGLGLFDRLIRGSQFWAFVVPLGITIATLIAWGQWGAIGALAIVSLAALGLLLQIVRLAGGVKGRPWGDRLRIATLTMLAKPAIAWGALGYRFDRSRGRTARLLEYKRPQAADTSRSPA